MRPPPLNLLGLAPLARPPGWCQLPPTLGCPPGPRGVSTDLQTVLVETSRASPSTVGTAARFPLSAARRRTSAIAGPGLHEMSTTGEQERGQRRQELHGHRCS